jgi:hypothetical protein
VKDRISLLTGAFGNRSEDKTFVEVLARKAKAIGSMPMYQAVRDPDCSFSRSVWVHPSFFLFFGYYKKIKEHWEVPVMPDDFWLGDIRREMVSYQQVPKWEHNDSGNPLLPSHGQISMKAIPWNKWCDEVFQTMVWVGVSITGAGARANQERKGIKWDSAAWNKRGSWQGGTTWWY